MANVRCPMCGKPNPEEAEVCQFCAARLKPLGPSKTGGNTPSPKSPGPEPDIPDWLRTLRDDVPESAQPSPAAGAPAEDESAGKDEIPDWLGRIRASAGDEENIPTGQESLPDWLSAETGGAEPPAAIPNENEPDWLKSLRSPSESPESSEEGAAPAVPAAFGGDEEIPDWLRGLSDADQPAEGQAQEQAPLSADETPAEAEQSPGWLSGLEQPSSIGEPAPQAEGTWKNDLPDWLAGLEEESSQAETLAAPETPSAPETLAAPETPAAAEILEAPELAEPETLPEVETPAAPEILAAAEIPAAEETLSAPEALAAPETSAATETLAAPETLSARRPEILAAPEIPAEAEAPEAPLAGAVHPAETGSLLNWLSSFEEATPASTEAPAEAGGPLELEGQQAAQPFQAETLPSFSSQDQAAPPFEQAPEAAPAGPGETGLPDWLLEYSAGGAAAAAEQVTPESLPGPLAPEETPEELAGPEAIAQADEESVPDWLRSLRATKPAEAPAVPLPSSQALVFEDTTHAAEPPSEGPAQPFPAEEMPDWLARMSPPAQAAPGAAPQEPGTPHGKEEEEITLAPAELPTWVQAMRPIESATPQTPTRVEGDDQIEEVGPLAGLRGVLPAEPLPGKVHKPPVYSVRLQVREKQRTNSALLETMVTKEAEPQPYTPARPFPSQRVVRLVIALVLIVAAAVALITGATQMSFPEYLTGSIMPVQNGINAIPPNVPVLLAVDYEPALAGEMEAAATGVVAHLMSRQANLVMISTNPYGQMLADRLLRNALKLQPAYSMADKTLNLGYLAGGPGALASFAIDPRAATPFTLDMKDAWQAPVLGGVNTLTDFAAVVVVTENLETARSWVEQVKPVLGTVPLYMVASAQIGPVISAYLDSGQVQGQITGLVGGAVYEASNNQIGNGRGLWDAFQFGLLVAIILILVGGLINSGNALFTRRKPKGEV